MGSIALEPEHEVELIHLRAELEVAFRRPVAFRIEELARARRRAQLLTDCAHIRSLARQSSRKDVGTQIVLLAAFVRILTHAHERHVWGILRKNVVDDGLRIHQGTRERFVGANGRRKPLGSGVGRVNERASLQIEALQFRR